MSRQSVIAVDLGLAALIAIVVLVLSPGIAVSAMIALFVALVCALSLAVERWLRRRRSRPRRVGTVTKPRP